MPLRHLVMLAPANHGSPLAALGKKRVGRIKAWFDDVQPGQRVLDWLSLGSEGQWNLNAAFRSYQCAGNGFFPFVLTGQGIDRSAYDFLNSYLTESGSDGVVRIAGANMNCRYISLQQTGEERHDTNDKRTYLKLASRTARAVSKPQKVPLGVFSCFSHTGTDMGIMAIKQRRSDHQRIVSAVLDCLLVVDSKSYRECGTALAALTAKEQLLQAKGRKDPENRYSMLVFRVRDENGGALDSEDVDVFLTAGNSYSKDHLPSGFSRDVQLNKRSNNLVFYLDAHRMSKIDDGMWGFQVVVRPEDGFSYYRAAEFRSEGLPVASVIAPNETTYVDVALNRCVDKNVFRFADASAHRESFKSVKPSGDEVP
jgi:hypothetical protein